MALLQVLFVDFKIRFVNDIGILWESISNSLNIDDLTIGIVSRPDCQESAVSDGKTSHLVNCMYIVELL